MKFHTDYLMSWRPIYVPILIHLAVSFGTGLYLKQMFPLEHHDIVALLVVAGSIGGTTVLAMSMMLRQYLGHIVVTGPTLDGSVTSLKSDQDAERQRWRDYRDGERARWASLGRAIVELQEMPHNRLTVRQHLPPEALHDDKEGG